MRVNREDLINVLESVEPGLSPRDIVEQSACFVFRKGWVITYNDEIACAKKTEVKFEGAVQAKPLLAILKKMTEEEVQLDQTEGELLLTGKNKEVGVTMEAEVLLPVDKIEKPKDWQELDGDFTDAVSLVQQCASKDASRFALTCVHITPDYIESCDNMQLTRYTVPTPIDEPILVKRDSLKHITQLGMTEFSETDAWIHFRNGTGLLLSCRKFNAEFPDLERVLAVDGTPTTLPKGLGDAADKAQVFTNEDKDNNEVLVELRQGKVRITGRGVNGWYKEVKRITYQGEPLQFLISPGLLQELIRQHNDCLVSARQLKVEGGKFVYVTSLGVPKDE